ncbi:MAG TPA: hypothetical protein VFS43_41230 [Polyangiaceae bacterium]|nr:hypothetical protein [Polyangiaceae bacterium]
MRTIRKLVCTVSFLVAGAVGSTALPELGVKVANAGTGNAGNTRSASGGGRTVGVVEFLLSLFDLSP